ncbi:MAG: cation-efflux pump, partial [Clostridiales bacterium]|nr:cation-efflux pump [Clostridiales bacterium]
MITFLAKIFIKNNTKDADSRRIYGTLCGITGIFLNIILFIGKLASAIVSGSVSVLADALNNLA